MILRAVASSGTKGRGGNKQYALSHHLPVFETAKKGTVRAALISLVVCGPETPACIYEGEDSRLPS